MWVSYTIVLSTGVVCHEGELYCSLMFNIFNTHSMLTCALRILNVPLHFQKIDFHFTVLIYYTVITTGPHKQNIKCGKNGWFHLSLFMCLHSYYILETANVFSFLWESITLHFNEKAIKCSCDSRNLKWKICWISD